MKALSIKEPWISMIVNEIKVIETRSWRTHYTGPILLVGCKKPNGRYSGLAACKANLVRCQKMQPADAAKAQCDYHNAFSWFLEDIERVEPFTVKGQQRLYNVPDELIKPAPLCDTCMFSGFPPPYQPKTFDVMCSRNLVHGGCGWRRPRHQCDEYIHQTGGILS